MEWEESFDWQVFATLPGEGRQGQALTPEWSGDDVQPRKFNTIKAEYWR